MRMPTSSAHPRVTPRCSRVARPIGVGSAPFARGGPVRAAMSAPPTSRRALSRRERASRARVVTTARTKGVTRGSPKGAARSYQPCGESQTTHVPSTEPRPRTMTEARVRAKAAPHTLRWWPKAWARTAVTPTKTAPSASRSRPKRTEPSGSAPAARRVTLVSAPMTSRVARASRTAASSGAWRPIREARSSSRRPVSSSLRVPREVSAIARTGTAKATTKPSSLTRTPPRVSSPATSPLSIRRAGVSEEAA